MKVFNRTDFPNFKWETLDGKQGTIRIGRDGFNDLVAFHEEDGGLYVLAWIDRRTGASVSDMLAPLATRGVMSFTDEDLNNLKDFVRKSVIRRELDGSGDETILFKYKMEALLARLEAAERVARWFDHIKTEDHNCEPFKDFEKWKKAAGKE